MPKFTHDNKTNNSKNIKKKAPKDLQGSWTSFERLGFFWNFLPTIGVRCLGCSMSVASAAPPSPKSCSFGSRTKVFLGNHEKMRAYLGGGGVNIDIYIYVRMYVCMYAYIYI